MAKNLRHARAVEKARLRKSESHNSSRLRDFTEKTDLTSRLPPYFSAKSQMFTDWFGMNQDPNILEKQFPVCNRCGSAKTTSPVLIN